MEKRYNMLLKFLRVYGRDNFKEFCEDYGIEVKHGKTVRIKFNDDSITIRDSAGRISSHVAICEELYNGVTSVKEMNKHYNFSETLLRVTKTSLKHRGYIYGNESECRLTAKGMFFMELTKYVNNYEEKIIVEKPKPVGNIEPPEKPVDLEQRREEIRKFAIRKLGRKIIINEKLNRKDIPVIEEERKKRTPDEIKAEKDLFGINEEYENLD